MKNRLAIMAPVILGLSLVLLTLFALGGCSHPEETTPTLEPTIEPTAVPQESEEPTPEDATESEGEPSDPNMPGEPLVEPPVEIEDETEALSTRPPCTEFAPAYLPDHTPLNGRTGLFAVPENVAGLGFFPGQLVISGREDLVTTVHDVIGNSEYMSSSDRVKLLNDFVDVDQIPHLEEAGNGPLSIEELLAQTKATLVDEGSMLASFAFLPTTTATLTQQVMLVEFDLNATDAITSEQVTATLQLWAFYNLMSDHIARDILNKPDSRPRADLNWMTFDADQWPGAALTPFPGNGSGGVSGAPAGLAVAATEVAAISMTARFQRQWAWGDIGGLTQTVTGSADLAAAPTTIAIFDSTPSLVVDTPDSVDILLTDYMTSEIHPVDMALCVTDFGAQNSATITNGMNSHGLFAASLASAVSPDSRIQLVKILEERRLTETQSMTGWPGLGSAGVRTITVTDTARLEGSLFATVGALHSYLDSYFKSPDAEDLPRLVINLSLGFRHDIREESQYALMQLATCALLADAEVDVEDACRTPPTELPVFALGDAFARMESRNVVVVAAAGNTFPFANDNCDGPLCPDPDRPEPIAPASYDSTIGVAASSPDGQLACYSHAGDVIAPGGAGHNDEPFISCDANFLHECATHPDCHLSELAILGLYDSGSHDFEYRYWHGTSFAAPIVSGLAARLLELQPGLTPDTIKDCLRNNMQPDSTNGVVNVEETLSNCSPASP